MSYIVLARKYRPKSFDKLSGQKSTTSTLKSSLRSKRIHHAWIFVGNRGVGKTSLSRILAKSLNCVIGITEKPCCICNICISIDSGDNMDCIEIDAASNRGVDEITTILEQAKYFPNSGRFKIYIIDEAHMLTNHAFNAMLKILEEPPKHVKFILSTTNSQKIPNTVLSRCMLFNLKNLSVKEISNYLSEILIKEKIDKDLSAITLIAKYSNGSMRDALSLTDQAINYNSDYICEKSVRVILGIIDHIYVINIINLLNSGKIGILLKILDKILKYNISYLNIISEISILLSKVAIFKKISYLSNKKNDIYNYYYVNKISKEIQFNKIQLFYSILVHARSEILLAPNEYTGFIMICLRILSFSKNVY